MTAVGGRGLLPRSKVGREINIKEKENTRERKENVDDKRGRWGVTGNCN